MQINYARFAVQNNGVICATTTITNTKAATTARATATTRAKKNNNNKGKGADSAGHSVSSTKGAAATSCAKLCIQLKIKNKN